MKQSNTTLDIRTVLALIRKNIVLMIILALIGAVIAYLYTDYMITPMYEASVTLVVNTRDEQSTLISTGEITSARQLINTYSVILTNDALLDDIITQLNLRTSISSLKSRISADAVNESQVMRMTVRDANPQTALAVLQFIMDRAPDLLIKTVKAGSVEIVSPPRPNYNPVSPNVNRNTTIGVIIGLVVVVAYIFIRKALENTFISEDDVGRYLELPLLGVIPTVDRQQKRFGKNGKKSFLGIRELIHDIAVRRRNKRRKTDLITNIDDAPFQYQEAINSLRTNLRFVSMTGECKKILVTSSIPDEGKTSIAINLAHSLASTGSSVLLIDCDLRKPVLHRYLKLTGGTSSGLTDMLQSKTIDAEFFRSIKPDFSVLPSGTVPPNPTAILGSHGMGSFLDEVSGMFDYVLLDTAPVALVTDAAVLSQYADGIMMVVRQKTVTFEQAIQAKKNLTQVNANIIGAVLNNFDARYIDKGSWYYSYNYYYEYREDNNPTVKKSV